MSYQEIVNMTTEKVKNLAAEDLAEVFKKINDLETALLTKAIRDSFNEDVPKHLRDERIAESLKMAVFRVVEGDL